MQFLANLSMKKNTKIKWVFLDATYCSWYATLYMAYIARTVCRQCMAVYVRLLLRV